MASVSAKSYRGVCLSQVSMRGEVSRWWRGQQSVSGGEEQGDFKGVFSTWELDFFQTQRISALEVPSRTSCRYLCGRRPAPGQ